MCTWFQFEATHRPFTCHSIAMSPPCKSFSRFVNVLLDASRKHNCQVAITNAIIFCELCNQEQKDESFVQYVYVLVVFFSDHIHIWATLHTGSIFLHFIRLIRAAAGQTDITATLRNRIKSPPPWTKTKPMNSSRVCRSSEGQSS